MGDPVGGTKHRSLELARLDAIINRLELLKDLVNNLLKANAGQGGPASEPVRSLDDGAAVYSRLTAWYDKAVNENRLSISQLQARIASTPTVPAEEWLQHWKDLITRERTVDRLIQTALDTVGSANVRGRPGATLAPVADALVQSFAQRLDLRGFDRLVLLSTTEQTRRDAWIIYARYPIDVWSLPVIAHEFGHVVVERYQDSNGDFTVRQFGIDLVQQRKPGALSVHHLAELLADGVATLILGPAYTATLVWRASPHAPDSSDGMHPAWSLRIAFSLLLLEQMKNDGGRVTADVIALISTHWGLAKRSPDVPGSFDIAVDLVNFLLTVVAPDHRFSWTGMSVKAALVGSESLAGADPVQLINAAWLARLDNAWDDSTIIAGRARAGLLEALT